jgi:hypothetical protein
MTNGQIAQLQELTKCLCMPRYDRDFVVYSLAEYYWNNIEPLTKQEKAQLRRLWHQYRGQIAAMKRNRGKG